jgi:hypothetical protein
MSVAVASVGAPKRPSRFFYGKHGRKGVSPAPMCEQKIGQMRF